MLSIILVLMFQIVDKKTEQPIFTQNLFDGANNETKVKYSGMPKFRRPKMGGSRNSDVQKWEDPKIQTIDRSNRP